MSTYIEIFEDEDPQQEQQLAEVTDRDIQAILATIADRLLHEEPSEVTDYIRVTCAERPTAPTHMDDTTAIRIGRWLSRVIAQSADDREGMLHAIGESR